jgi:hypothetical protein
MMVLIQTIPLPMSNHQERAVQMAVAMRARFEAIAGAWSKLGYDIGHGIGDRSGYATIGAIGFEGRWDYGSIGHGV